MNWNAYDDKLLRTVIMKMGSEIDNTTSHENNKAKYTLS